MRRVTLFGYFQIVTQKRFIVRVGTILDYLMSPMERALAPKVGNALLSNDDIDIMFGRVDM